MPDDRESRGAGGAEKGRPGETPEPAGGWRSQGRGLKILLFASVAIAIFAVVRCSLELAGPSKVETVGVLRPSVDVPEGIFPASSDSVRAIAARQMARALRAASGVDVTVVDAASEAAGAVAAFSLTSTRGNVAVVLEITDSRSRVLSRAESEGPPEHLYAVLSLAARRAAADLWPSSAEGGGGNR